MPHLIFSAYNVFNDVVPPTPNRLRFVKPKLLHWSPASGLRQVAGKFNIPTLADTITQALMAPVGQPSVSLTYSGKLICTFTAFLNGNTQVVDDGSIVNAGEIYATTSNDNGMTWGIPENRTFTPNIEEKHSSLINHAVSDSFKVYFVRDMKAGSWVSVPSWGKAPVFGIYSTFQLFGINQISTEAVSYNLSQNYPNPFNPNTVISYQLTVRSYTKLEVFDILGNKVATLVNEKQNEGSYSVDFNGAALSSGVYFYKIISGDFVDTKRMVLIK